MMGNDMSLEREHSECVWVCVPMNTQWFTLSSIEPIHRSSQRGFNTHPHNNLYIYTVDIVHHKYSVSYLKLSLCHFVSLFL